MPKLIKEHLFEQDDEFEPTRKVNLQDEISYFTDLELNLSDDSEYAEAFYDAIEEFGISKEDTGMIGSYGYGADWEDLKDELDRLQIEYYEFDTNDGESVIFLNVNDLEN